MRRLLVVDRSDTGPAVETRTPIQVNCSSPRRPLCRGLVPSARLTFVFPYVLILVFQNKSSARGHKGARLRGGRGLPSVSSFSHFPRRRGLGTGSDEDEEDEEEDELFTEFITSAQRR